MHAFGTIGRGLGVVPFYHYWLRGRAEGIAAPLADYILSAVAARGTGTAAEHISHAFHLDASLLAALLRRVAEAGGVERIEGSVAAIERGETGDIAALRLDGDRCVDGDFFLDCTGFRALLIGRALGVGFERLVALAAVRPRACRGLGEAGAAAPLYARDCPQRGMAMADTAASSHR